MNLINWVKHNKLATVLILVVAFLLLKNRLFIPLPLRSKAVPSPTYNQTQEMIAPQAVGGMAVSEKANLSTPISRSEPAPQPEIKDRLVVETSNVSLVVDDVQQKVDAILDQVANKNGYMVSSSLSQPQEAPFATLVVRLPSQELRPTLDFLRGLAIKVTSENLQGYDVTDQYVDLEARLKTLSQTKAKFEEILNKASTVDQIMQVQREIINLQSQIDSLKGQQQYLEKSAQNAKLTIYLSSDEWVLPYAPQEPSFRPKIIFKTAVRSLVKVLRVLAKLGIWVGVFSVIWLPVLLVYRWWKRRK